MLKERFKYILAVILYGTVGMFLRFVDLPSEAASLYRGFVGALFILFYRLALRQRPELKAIRKNRVWLLCSGIALGLTGSFCLPLT